MTVFFLIDMISLSVICEEDKGIFKLFVRVTHCETVNKVLNFSYFPNEYSIICLNESIIKDFIGK